MLKKRFAFIFIAIWASAHLCFAETQINRIRAVRPKVVLVTSLDTSYNVVVNDLAHTPLAKLRFFLDAEYFETFVRNLGSIFNRQISDGDWDVEVVHRSDADGLSRILQSGQNIAVFYLAHAAFSEGTSKAVTGGKAFAITDYYLNDIKYVFSRIHPNLKFLALIGCRSGAILEEMKKQGYFADNPDLRFFSTDGVTEAKTGLSQAVRAWKDFVRKSDVSQFSATSCKSEWHRQGYRLNITRRIPLNLGEPIKTVYGNLRKKIPGSVMVLMRDQLIATFPQGQPGEIQSKSVWIEGKLAADSSKANIFVNSGANPLLSRQPIEMGEFTFELSDTSITEVSWRPLSLNGSAVGATRQLYLLQNEPSGRSIGDFLEHGFEAYECVRRDSSRLYSHKWESPYPF